MKMQPELAHSAEPEAVDQQNVAVPMYRTVANAIERDIANNVYPAGAKIPTEAELMQRFGVSRHTVRQALRGLRDSGALISRRGVGTIVNHKHVRPKFLTGVNSLDDLQQFVEATELHIYNVENFTVNAYWADILRCEIGEKWIRADVVRVARESHDPLSHLQAFTPARYARVLRGVKTVQGSIYSRLERMTGLRIVELSQKIVAETLEPCIAKAVHAKPGIAALKITRWYIDQHGGIPLVGIGHYPGDRYSQETHFRMQGRH